MDEDDKITHSAAHNPHKSAASALDITPPREPQYNAKDSFLCHAISLENYYYVAGKKARRGMNDSIMHGNLPIGPRRKPCKGKRAKTCYYII